MSHDTSINDTTDETAQAPTTQDHMKAALAAKGGDGGGRVWEGGVLSDFISPEQLALELGISTRTLDRWRVMREGPPRTKIGKRTVYRRDSVAAWLLAQEIEAA